MAAIILEVLSFLWDIAKIWLAVGAAYGVCVLYRLIKGYIKIWK